jgi:hypothetical protein
MTFTVSRDIARLTTEPCARGAGALSLRFASDHPGSLSGGVEGPLPVDRSRLGLTSAGRVTTSVFTTATVPPPGS